MSHRALRLQTTSPSLRAGSAERRRLVTEAVVFRSPDEERAEIKGRVLARLLAHTQEDSTAPEAGGILMGLRILDSGDVVVDMVTEPFPTDQRGRFKFVRFPEGH